MIGKHLENIGVERVLAVVTQVFSDDDIVLDLGVIGGRVISVSISLNCAKDLLIDLKELVGDRKEAK